MSTLRLYSAERCPFAQRTWIVLNEKGLEADLVEIDLDDKLASFEEISPYKKVPLLEHDGCRLYESSIINEYLDEVFPQPPLLPSEAARRALARIWIDFADARWTPTFYKMLLEQDDQRQCALVESFRQQLLFMEHEGLAKLGDGPYWLGAEFSLVDVAFCPHFERLSALEHYRGFTLPAECARLGAWAEAVAGRPTVRVLSRSTEYYVRGLAAYADGTADGVTAREMRGA